MSRSPTLAEQLAQFGQPRFTPYDPETGKGLDNMPETRYSTAISGGEYAAPSAHAPHEYGVVFRADHETLADGMCRQARAHARVLHRFLPVLLSSINGKVRRPVFDEDTKQQIGLQTFSLAGDDMLEEEVFREVGEIRRTVIRNYLAAIYHTTIHSAGGLRSLLLPEYTRASIGAADRLLARSIVYTPWERSTVGPEIIEVLREVGQVWLQCSRNCDAFIRSGLPREKIRLIPPAFEPDGLVAQIPTARKPVPGGRRFYNIGKWEPRKGQHWLIGAFLQAFKPTDDASLTLKVSYFGEWTGYPALKETLALWLATPSVRQAGWTSENVTRSVSIYDRQFDDAQMAKLHELHNIYVSASHAEGWDYPAFDAKTAGNRLVHVGFGGSEDYAESNDIRVEWEYGPVNSEYGWEASAEWAHYSLENLAEALYYAKPRPTRERPIDFAHHYGVENIGKMMLKQIGHLVHGTDPTLWDAAEASWRTHAG